MMKEIFTKVKYIGKSSFWFEYNKIYWVLFGTNGDTPRVYVYAADNDDAYMVSINESRYERDFCCVM